jgi:hypothetical protein
MMCVMRIAKRRGGARILAAIAAATATSSALATTLRMVSYNIDASDTGVVMPSGLPTAIQGIGNHHVAGNAQAVDVLGMQELLDTSNTTSSSTLPAVVNALNSIYGAGTYAYDATPDPTTGGSSNGPSGLVYNTQKIQVIAATPIGSIGGPGSGLGPRTPMRYQLRPVGYGSDADFYMYVSHYKAGSTADDIARRSGEATQIRADADALGPNAHLVYSFDSNFSQAHNEPAYATLTGAGNGRGYDLTAPTTNYVSAWVNSTSVTTSAPWKHLYSQSTNSLGSRLDFQLVSNAVLTQNGLQIAPDASDAPYDTFPSSKYPYAYEVFGNNGTTPAGGRTDVAANTSLSDLANASDVKAALMQPSAGGTGSDHLPVMADYNLVGVVPLQTAWVWLGGTDSWSNSAKWNSGLVPDSASIHVRTDNGNATASVVTLDQDASIGDLLLDANDTLIINSAKTLTLAGPAVSVLRGAVNLSAGGTLKLGAATTILSSTAAMSSGKIDLQNHKLITQSAVGSWNGSSYTGVTGQIASGRNGGSWTGAGIVTSQSSASTSNLTSIGVATASQARGIAATATTTFGGQTVTGSDTLAMYTYGGDANLDGKINVDDYTRIDFNVPLGSSGWFNGDFNYDGKINVDDYTIIDFNVGIQGAPFSTSDGLSGVSAIPEPLALGPIAMGALLLGPKRRRVASGE